MEHIIPQTSHKKALLSGIVILVALSAGVAAEVFLSRPVTRARTLLSETTSLQVGRSGLTDVQRLASHFGGAPDADCTAAHCAIAIKVDNSEFPEWWRGPGTTFVVGLSVENGILVAKAFSLWSGVGPNGSFVEVSEKEHWREIPEPVFVQTQATTDDPRWRAIVNLTPAAPPKVRERYLSFNLRCLSKFHGCKDAQDLLPTVTWNK